MNLKRTQMPECICASEDSVTIPISEYEKLQQDSRRVAAIRGIMDEFYMRRKLLLGTDSLQAMKRLRRVTLNRISIPLSEAWDG